MIRVDITPQAHADINEIKEYLKEKFGERSGKKIVGGIYDDLEKLSVFPQMGIDFFKRYGIETDYLCLITHRNYAFYRIEGNIIRIIRVMDERRDFMRILFGIVTTSEDTENYWNE